MKSIIKPMSFALSLLLALSLLGCSAAPKDTAAPIATEAPAAASAPTPEPEPTEDTARAEAEAALKELDERMFAESVVSDALSFHLTYRCASGEFSPYNGLPDRLGRIHLCRAGGEQRREHSVA